MVEKAHHWPGVTSLEAHLHGSTLFGDAPEALLPPGGSHARVGQLRFTKPRGLEHLSDGELAKLILERVRVEEESAAAERRRLGTTVLGRKGVLAQRWSDRPGSREPRRALDPRVAARSQWSRLEALLRNRSFRDAYAAAREAFIAGVTSVLFPAGTYWLHRFANAPCEPLLSAL